MQNMNIAGADFQLLRAFDALIGERSVSRAAQRLETSQPAMSRSLARLRLLFGDPLLLRGQGGMVPTRRALELQEPVRRILGDIDRIALKPTAFVPRTSQVRFVVTATEYAEYVLAPALMGRLQREAPGVRVEIRAPHIERAMEWLEQGEIDFRVGWLPAPPLALRSKLLFRDRFVCLARKGHPAIRGALSLTQYFAAQHVHPRFARPSTSGQVIDDAVAAHGRKLDVALVVQNFLSVAHTVAQSDLIATVPDRLARSLADRLPLQKLKVPLDLPELRIGVYWHERTQQEPAHRWFRQLLAEVARTL
jgi:DNA-binding transcriptional LysR family regulator